ncbi:MAG: ferrous iron transport protein A [Promethearchaeota archaeon]
MVPKLTKTNEVPLIVPLINLKGGEKGKITAIHGGRMVTQRLYDLGLTIGTELRILGGAPFGGPIQILVRGSVLAIGHGIATKIMVQCQT